MVSVHADDKQLLKDLGRFVEPVEVYDPQGKLLGLFVPANLERTKAKYEQLQAMVDSEEIARRKSDLRDCIPHETVVARLEALNLESERRKQMGEQPLTVEEAKAFMRSGHVGSSGQSSSAPNSV
jgi:hypothetical protein